MDFGTVLRILREIRGWTQRDLAKAAGIHHPKISIYESGKAVPNSETVRRILGAFGYPESAVWQVSDLIESLRSAAANSVNREVDQAASQAGMAVASIVRLVLQTMTTGKEKQP